MLALLLQALFAAPLAVRMASDALQAFDLGAAICTADPGSGHGGAGQGSDQPMPGHVHGQCLICHGHALPHGLLAVVLFLVALLLVAEPGRHRRATVPPPRRRRYQSYHSRAPPQPA